ncbi:MAG TPA: sulfatase-like hydrolase/transferase [Acidobacteriaceae bacterium]|nr:sulfatase-like hydrolase/transferase [Acidobacteriaceae bacterium]
MASDKEGGMHITRRTALGLLAGGLAASSVETALPLAATTKKPPNVVFVLLDDVGYGDLACLGNPVIKTPNIDDLYSRSARFTDFHASPTCSPSRASFMTGRYSNAVGVWHTIDGRNLLRTNARTLAECFTASGYRTANYGKWHLGDNYPCRPQDRGFDDAVVCGGGGIWQAPDYFGNDDVDDSYIHNGKFQKYTGFSTDIFFDRAMDFMRDAHRREQPFFCYLATTAAHEPVWAQEKDQAPYEHVPGLVHAGFYGMIANIDGNLGRSGGKPEDQVIDVKTGLPGGGRFGPSPCLGSRWAEEYFKKVHHFLEFTGMDVFLNDGSYPGDLCASTSHPGHKGYLDSQWQQWKIITKLYRWCRAQGLYLKVPDWYFLNGQSKTGMGYTETDWSLPREYQPVIERQDIYDCTWEKTPSMGWMHVPLVQYHGGGEAATVEPLSQNFAHYETRFADLLGAGVQATWRGTRLYDTAETRKVVEMWVDFYKRHRAILGSDIIHLRRPDGRDWDGILHVNPRLETRAMAVIYNPLDVEITRRIELPLYYTGLTETAQVREREMEAKTYTLTRKYSVIVALHIPARSRTWLTIQ